MSCEIRVPPSTLPRRNGASELQNPGAGAFLMDYVMLYLSGFSKNPGTGECITRRATPSRGTAASGEEGDCRLIEEQRRREEEQRRREQIEATAQGSNLIEFLEQCHDLYMSMEVVTNKSLTTQGDVTNHDNRLYPKRIIAWKDFDTLQAAVWARICADSDFAMRRWFPSMDNFAYERDRLRPVSSESALRRFEAVATENMVGDLFRRAREDKSVKHELGVESEMGFQDHTNLGDGGNLELAQTMQDLRLQQNTKRSDRQQSSYRHRGTADQFCILQSENDGSRRPSVAIEYKPPHKLSTHTISVGLKEDILTFEDAAFCCSVKLRNEPAK